jgi:hypothetical protein
LVLTLALQSSALLPAQSIDHDSLEVTIPQLENTPLSQSLPLRTKRFKRSDCRGYFAGLNGHGRPDVTRIDSRSLAV